MSRKSLSQLRPRSVYDVCAALALFIALGTGGAYAANTIGSADIIDGSIGSADVKDNSINTFDVHSFLGADVVDGSLSSADVENDSIQGIDIQNDSLGNDDFDTGAVQSRAVLDGSLTTSDVANGSLTGLDISFNSLTGEDINESSLVGVKDGCHAGAILLGRICAGSDGVARSQYDAFFSCAAIGLRLPTLSEAKLMAINYDVPGVDADFWTDSIAGPWQSTDYLSNAVQDFSGNHIATPARGLSGTVCVETPTNL